MSYLQDRRKDKKKIRNILIVVVVFLFLFYFQNSVFNNLSSAANVVFKPIITLSNNIGMNFSGMKSFFISKRTLQVDNENLIKDLEQMNAATINYQSIKDENDQLKEVLGRKAANAEFVVSSILSKPNKSLYDTLLIDVGNKNGIEPGDMVFALGNIPVGKITEVFNNSSKVVLFSTSGEKTDVVVGSNGVFMQIVGRGGGNFEIVLPRDFDLSEGTEITMPGINSYLIAKVVTIVSDPRDSYKKALLVSPVNIQNLRFVQVQK